MKRDNHKIMNYKFRRDACREDGNLFLESFYQMRIVNEIEKSRFYLRKKSDLEQHWQILHGLLDRALGIDDEVYQKGIYYEVILSNMGILLSDEEKVCQIYCSFWERSRNVEYVDGAYQIHINGILEIAKEDSDAAERYADNLLILLNMRYGIDSCQYARMKLYLVGEYYRIYKKEFFLFVFREDYDYFRQYTADNDFHFCRILILYTLRLGEDGDRDYELWMDRCEDTARQWQGDAPYPFLQCEIAWVKAIVLERQSRHEEALVLLQKAIADYLEKDNGDRNPFYGYLYLVAAYTCCKIQVYDLMLHYTQKGLAMCEDLNLVGSELYYNLYHNVGFYHILEQNWGEAEKLYSSCIRDIEERYGKENENYAIYMGQLVCIALRQGKDVNFFNEIKCIKDEKLRKKVKVAFVNELNQVIANGQSISDIQKTYRKCVQNLDAEEDRQELERLDILYLAAMAQIGQFETEFDFLVKKLSENYYNDFTGELGILYWESILLWEWSKGNTEAALKISERILHDNPKTKDYNIYLIAVYNVQLLILNGQYDKAKELIITLLDRLDDLILKIGFGNPSRSLFFMRIFLSMYIYVFLQEENSWNSNAREAELLLEKLIRCKTIEKEIKGLLGKEGMDEYVDMYHFRQSHRKMAALDMRRDVARLKKEDYERKRMQCLMEMAEYETNLNQSIPFRELICKFRFEEIRIPEDAICLEFFAYYNFCTDGPMFIKWGDELKEIYSYLTFVLSEDAGRVKINKIINIPLATTLEEERIRLLDAAEDTNKYEIGEINEIVRHLNQIFASPFLQYFDENKKVYLGLDYMLQVLPMDLIFCNRKGEPMNVILTDSARYIRNDIRINMEESDALIIGNPQLDSQDAEYKRLPCGELESKKIAEMFGTRAYVGKEAKQSVLWRRESKDVIHISAHGVLDEKSLEDVIKSNLFINSYLEFAGCRDWEEGRKNQEYGNGIISADDFLFMDLSKVKLVVLSACVSSLGYTKGLQNVHGMRWALGAAGAENSVTALWSVSEVATAVLMVLFYRNLYTMPVGEALYEAKRQLRTITTAELRKDSVLRQMIEMGGRGQEADDRPFQNWRYWAAFVCYHR